MSDHTFLCTYKWCFWGRIHSLFFKVSRAAKIIQTDLQFYITGLQVSPPKLVERFFFNREYGVRAYSDICWVSLDLGGICRYSDSQRAGQSGFRTQMGARFSGPIQTEPPTDLFPVCKWRGHGADHAPRSSAGVK